MAAITAICLVLSGLVLSVVIAAAVRWCFEKEISEIEGGSWDEHLPGGYRMFAERK